jgi:hypothetical protein
MAMLVQAALQRRSSPQLTKQESRFSVTSTDSVEDEQKDKQRAALIQEEVAAQGTVKRMSARRV